jgi:hypothetical protein
MHDNNNPNHGSGGSPRMTPRWGRKVFGLAATGALLVGGAGAAIAATGGGGAAASHGPDIKLVALNPKAGDIAGKRGDFTVALMATARNAAGTRALSAVNGYRPGLNLPPAATFGPGLPDPNSPGLVVTLSTTPMAAGGPRANLAGVFQLNTVTRHHGLTRVINDWEVGSPGFFGKNTPVTLTAFLVKGTAPARVTGHEQPISNVIHERFTIGR